MFLKCGGLIRRLTRTLSPSLFHDNSVYISALIVPLAEAISHPAVVLIESDGGQIWLSHFKEQRSLCRDRQSFEEGRSNSAPAAGRVYRKVQQLGFVRITLA